MLARTADLFTVYNTRPIGGAHPVIVGVIFVVTCAVALVTLKVGLGRAPEADFRINVLIKRKVAAADTVVCELQDVRLKRSPVKVSDALTGVIRHIAEKNDRRVTKRNAPTATGGVAAREGLGILILMGEEDLDLGACHSMKWADAMPAACGWRGKNEGYAPFDL